MINTKSITAANICVIGSTNVDFIMQVAHLPALGETVTDGVFTQTWGGKGANQAVAAARAGATVTFVTGLGNDLYTETILDNFHSDGIDTQHVLIDPTTPCGSALVMFDRKGHNYLTVAPGANYALTPTHIETCREAIQSAQMLILQMEIPTPTINRALGLAHECETPVLFNYAPVRDLSVAISDRIHTLVVNENEAAALTGLGVETPADALAAAEILRAKGVAIVIVTLGANGAVAVSDTFRCHVPAFSVKPVDTTAAGDVFCGALAVAIAEGRVLADALRFANAASALSVTKAGAQPSVPHRADIDTLLKDNP